LGTGVGILYWDLDIGDRCRNTVLGFGYWGQV